jgi:hypothetical protein
MYEIQAYKISLNSANIFQLPVKRDWMDETFDAHAYKCFPITLTNSLGWGLSFPEDISFIWDGISDSSPNHVKILSGEKYCYTERGNATISFRTGLILKTNEDVTLLQMPAPNMFIEGIQSFTALISTSFFNSEFPCALRITKPNSIITIKADQPIISIIPLNLKSINNSEIKFKNISKMPKQKFNNNEYSKSVQEITSSGAWTNFYRNATDHKGNKIGEHELKSLKLRVINE